ncbi:MAG TPA: phospho-sugar mutase [Kineosporiaceae bacterium]|nr:phospho-sugar mutase [Kineosporiaceae bacterium]
MDTSLDATADLLRQARAWRDTDPDPDTRAELTDLLTRAGADGHGTVTPAGETASALAELADRFAGMLQFGTAGLRGALGAGPNRMNRVVVIRAAAGLATYLTQRVTGTPRVVVGFDARHKSDQFAHDTCAVLTAAGCEAMVLPRPLPTPVLAFAVRHLGADAGVMVTASHNPPQDNGYKVYLGGRVCPGPGNGVQIVPPADADISAAIAAVGPLPEVPLAGDGWHTLDDGVLADYVAGAAAVVAPGGPRDVDLVVTPLHGVGGDTVRRALVAAGFPEPYVVAEQAAPDPDFPTVAFPNPEEPGAVDLAVAAARSRGADLVIANDPDADRCAVAVADPALPDHPDGGPGWRMLRGDELGALLGRHVLARRVREGVQTLPDGVAPVVACSIVSSQLLGRIAAGFGFGFGETLTGFKWIARVEGLVFGYEEALGYCVAPTLVRDKDGISAALLVAELAAELKAAGRTLLDALDDLHREHGVHATDQLSIRVADLRLIAEGMHRLRECPPAVLGGGRVVRCDDLAEGAGGLPPTDGLRYRTDHGVRVVVRPSGTEPKLKCYLEAVLPPGGDLAADRARAAAVLQEVRADLSAALGL